MEKNGNLGKLNSLTYLERKNIVNKKESRTIVFPGRFSPAGS